MQEPENLEKFIFAPPGPEFWDYGTLCSQPSQIGIINTLNSGVIREKTQRLEVIRGGLR